MRFLIAKTNTKGDRGRVAQRLRSCATNRKVAGSIPAGVSGFFIDTKSFRSHYGPGVDLASNRNEYQEYFLGYGRPVRKADNLPPSCAVVKKSGNLNFLESSGPVQACNGTDLPLPFKTNANLRKHSLNSTTTKHIHDITKSSRVSIQVYCTGRNTSY